MQYDYECEKCDGRTERSFRIGQAPRTVKCGSCGKQAKRVYNGFALGINGGIDRPSTFGEEMKNRNKKAATRMQGREAPVKLIAHDYGNGDIREAK